MFGKLLCAVAPVVLLSACVKPEQVIIGGCEKLKPPPACTGSKSNPVVTINIQGKIVVSPPNVCAQPGATVEININPKPELPATVALIPKILTNTWLLGGNSEDSDKILVHIPLEAKGNYDYSVFTASGDCVDPRMHVDD
jgi:hypothetical protein